MVSKFEWYWDKFDISLDVNQICNVVGILQAYKDDHLLKLPIKDI